MERLSLRDLMRATGGRLQGIDCDDLTFSRVSIDSRSTHRGDVFWALKGERHDGHQFTRQAREREACLCVVSSENADAISGPILIVDDTLAAVGRLANWCRRQSDALVIGVTGSVGKTTTRELIYSALSSQFRGTRSRLNFNNEIGLPLCLLDIECQHEFAVIEMGASKIDDIRKLCDLAHPEVGVVTAIGPAHLESFGSLAAIIQTKGELLEQLPSSGFAVIPGDSVVLRQMADRAPCPVILVGENTDNRIRATCVEVQAGSLQFECEGHHFNVPVTGRHLLSNALCAIAIGLEIGVPLAALASGLANFRPEPGRCGLTQIGPWTVIDDTYNASPLAVSSACRLLGELVIPRAGQRLLVLGDMRELGETAAVEHEQIGFLAAQLQIDRLLVCGKHADHVVRGAERNGMKSHQIASATDAETLLTVLDCWLEPDDILLVKGSRVTRMERVIDWLKDRALRDLKEHEDKPRRFCA